MRAITRDPTTHSAAPTHRLIIALVRTALLLAVSGCAGAAPPPTSSGGPTPTLAATEQAGASAPTPTRGRECPIPERGGTCLGVVSAGTYTTTSFTPMMTYTLPENGWANWEDLRGIVLLLAPGETLAGVEPDTSEFIGVFRSVGAAASGCDELVEPGIGHSARALADWFTSQPGLVVTEPQPTSVGGLRGLMMDVTLAPDWTGRCPYIPDIPLVPLIYGTGLSEGLGVVVEASWTTRLYVLDYKDDNITVYVEDHPGRLSLDVYNAVVQTFRFE